jgi:xylulokinase
MDVVIGVDIGTRSSKAVLCRPDGSIAAEAAAEHGVSFPLPGHMEHDADGVWWSDTTSLLRQLTASAPAGSRVAAVAVSAIGPCLLPVDVSGRPLRPGILYGSDTRAAAQIAALEERHGAALTRFAGIRLTSQAAGPKILWLRERESDVYARTASLLTSTGYVVFRLTGVQTIDHHNASYFAPFYDVTQARWDFRFADDAIPEGLLPELSWPGEIVGRVTPEAAAQTGLPVGTPVTAGTTDGAAEAVGAGVREPGDLMVSYGSTSALVLVLDRYRSVPTAWVTRGSSPGEYVCTLAMSTTGSITSWFREQFARELPGGGWEQVRAAHAHLVGEAERSPVGARGLLVLPYFSGERSPFYDPLARGVIAGLSLSHTRGDIYRAIMEATAYGIRHNVESMTGGRVRVRRVVAAGGGAASRLWLQIVSDVTGLTQEVTAAFAGAAYGNAYLAARAVGLIDPGEAAADGWVHTSDRVYPDPATARLYADRYRSYRDLYETTRDIVHDLAVRGATEQAEDLRDGQTKPAAGADGPAVNVTTPDVMVGAGEERERR